MSYLICKYALDCRVLKKTYKTNMIHGLKETREFILRFILAKKASLALGDVYLMVNDRRGFVLIRKFSVDFKNQAVNFIARFLI